MAIVRVGRRGQVTLPFRLRRDLGMTAGAVLLIEQTGPSRFVADVVERRSITSFPVRDGTVDVPSLREEIGRVIAGDAFAGDPESLS